MIKRFILSTKPRWTTIFLRHQPQDDCVYKTHRLPWQSNQYLSESCFERHGRGERDQRNTWKVEVFFFRRKNLKGVF